MMMMKKKMVMVSVRGVLVKDSRRPAGHASCACWQGQTWSWHQHLRYGRPVPADRGSLDIRRRTWCIAGTRAGQDRTTA